MSMPTSTGDSAFYPRGETMIRISLLAAVCLAALPATNAAAQTYKFKTINYSKSSQTSLHGVNDSGVAVGGFFTATNPYRNCFILQGKKKTAFTNPNGTETECWDINSNGDIVGDYADSAGVQHGYLYIASSQTFTTIDPPGTTETEVYGVNDSDVVGGYYFDSSGNQNGFIFTGKKYIKVNIKGGTTNQVFGINKAGQFTASATLSDGYTHSYLFPKIGTKNGVEIVFSGQIEVAAHHLNNVPQIIATVIDSSNNYSAGVYDAAASQTYLISVPNAVLTIGDGINDSQTLVGRFTDSASNSHGWLATGKL